MQKIGLILGETVFILLRFSEVPGPTPPPFQNPAYDTIGNTYRNGKGAYSNYNFFG